MANRRASREEIEALASDGWRFRKKPRNGILYVGARRGKKDHSLGRYSDEYWAMIEDVIRSLAGKRNYAGIKPTQTEPKEVADPLILALNEIERNLKIHLLIQCLHQEADYFCGYWLLEDLPRHGKQLSQKELEYAFKKVNSVDGKAQAWAFKPTVGICSICPSFRGIKNKSTQFPRVKSLPRGMMPIYNP